MLNKHAEFDALVAGFVKQCEARGVDPAIVIKHALANPLRNIGQRWGNYVNTHIPEPISAGLGGAAGTNPGITNRLRGFGQGFSTAADTNLVNASKPLALIGSKLNQRSKLLSAIDRGAATLGRRSAR